MIQVEIYILYMDYKIQKDMKQFDYSFVVIKYKSGILSKLKNIHNIIYIKLDYILINNDIFI